MSKWYILPISFGFVVIFVNYGANAKTIGFFCLYGVIVSMIETVYVKIKEISENLEN